MRASPGLPVPPPYAGPAVKPSFALNLFPHFPGAQGFPVPPLRTGPPVKPSFTQHAIDAAWNYPGMQSALAIMGAAVAVLVAIRAFSYIRHRARRGTATPVPPGEGEHYSYFRHQWRKSLTVIYVLLSAGGLYGLWAVFTKSWVWYPFLITLAVMVPWTLYMITVTLRKPVITMGTHEAAVADRYCPPSVDVFITFCGEDYGVVRNTFAHVQLLDWAGVLNVYVLDDSSGEDLRELSHQCRFTYLRRPDRPYGKKSGNLNHAFSRSSGDFIVVFDADFAPAPSFLRETIPYFLGADVGIVQTSQYFSIGRKDTANWIARLGGVVQGMFFCWSQPGQQSRDAAFCVGTNVLYRRAAVTAVGGIPICEHGGEDIITSVHMLALGWRTVYVPVNLARGLCPDTFAGAINQQYRWALTTFALIFPVRGMGNHDSVFWNCKMTLAQRVSYLAGLLYYAQSLLTLIVGVVPALIMLWAYPYQVGPGNYLPIAPAMLSMAALPLMVPGWRPEMLRLSVLYAVAHLLAAMDAITGRVQGWVPSGSTKKPKKNRTPRRASVIIRSWVIITQGLTAWALARDLPIYGMSAYWIPLALAIMQAAVLLPLLLPGYGTTGLNLRRAHAYLLGHIQRPRRATRSLQVDLLREPAGGREQRVGVLRAGSGGVQSRRAGAHRKPRQRDIHRVERPQPVPFRQGLDERQVRVPLRPPRRGGQPAHGDRRMAGDLAPRLQPR